VEQLQADEIWTFCKVKQGHLRPDHDERVMGDAYTFIGLDRVSKLVVALAPGQARSGEHRRFHFESPMGHF
jgi:hypothetical protein